MRHFKELRGSISYYPSTFLTNWCMIVNNHIYGSKSTHYHISVKLCDLNAYFHPSYACAHTVILNLLAVLSFIFRKTRKRLVLSIGTLDCKEICFNWSSNHVPPPPHYMNTKIKRLKSMSCQFKHFFFSSENKTFDVCGSWKVNKAAFPIISGESHCYLFEYFSDSFLPFLFRIFTEFVRIESTIINFCNFM